jgi:hypothetical protein
MMPVLANGTKLWRKAILALCAGLVGVALAYVGSPPKPVALEPGFGFYRMSK